MLEGVILKGRRRQVSQGAGWGQFELAICLSVPIPLAKEIWLLTILPDRYMEEEH